MPVQRWKFQDPDTTRFTPIAQREYTFPVNPREMTSLYADRTVTARATTGGGVVVYEGSSPPKEWTFSGIVYSFEQHEAMRNWLLEKKKRLFVFDHFGRRITFYPVSLELRPKRDIKRYWSHEYRASGLVIAVKEATIKRNYYA